MSENQGEIVPQEAEKGTKYRKILVKIYLSQEEFKTLCSEAHEAGFRHGGLQPFNKKAHGFGWELIANTKGLSKYLKWCRGQYLALSSLKGALQTLTKPKTA